MTSFDVSSLFTNIPLEETIDFCTDLVFKVNDKLKYSMGIVLWTTPSF